MFLVQDQLKLSGNSIPSLMVPHLFSTRTFHVLIIGRAKTIIEEIHDYLISVSDKKCWKSFEFTTICTV